jgi:hypothetical protein
VPPPPPPPLPPPRSHWASGSHPAGVSSFDRTLPALADGEEAPETPPSLIMQTVAQEAPTLSGSGSTGAPLAPLGGLAQLSHRLSMGISRLSIAFAGNDAWESGLNSTPSTPLSEVGAAQVVGSAVLLNDRGSLAEAEESSFLSIIAAEQAPSRLEARSGDDFEA